GDQGQQQPALRHQQRNRRFLPPPVPGERSAGAELRHPQRHGLRLDHRSDHGRAIGRAHHRHRRTDLCHAFHSRTGRQPGPGASGEGADSLLFERRTALKIKALCKLHSAFRSAGCQTRLSSITSASLPDTVLLASAANAASTSPIGKVRSRRGVSWPRAKSGQTLSCSSAISSALSSASRLRRVEPISWIRLASSVPKSTSPLRPPIRPIITQRASLPSTCRLSAAYLAPTGSSTRSNGAKSRSASSVSPRSTPPCAPRDSQYARRSAEPTLTQQGLSSALHSWIAADPTPLAPACNRTRSPGCKAPSRYRLSQAVA